MSNLNDLPLCDGGRCAALLAGVAGAKVRHDGERVALAQRLGVQMAEVMRRAVRRANLSAADEALVMAAVPVEAEALLAAAQAEAGDG